MKRSGKVFVDANILIYAESYKSADVFEWMNSLYEEIYIHKIVLDELVLSAVRQKVEYFIEAEKWILFDPDDETKLSEDIFSIYNAYVKDIREAFRELDEKKKKEGRPLKNTNDLGEMHSLAAAMLLSASIICSNDYDISEVIIDTPLTITLNEEEESVLIQQDTLLDLCYYVIEYGIEKRNTVRRFFKLIQPNQLDQLDKRF